MSTQAFSKNMAMILQPVHFLVHFFGQTELGRVRKFGISEFLFILDQKYGQAEK